MDIATTIEKQGLPSFIVIDDDPLNNKICGMFIRKVIPDADITTFIDPKKAVNYIQTLVAPPGKKNVVLFLDINMPGVDGWKVLEEFKSLYTEHTIPVLIYMLSSSVNPQDSYRANDPFVCGYIEKPLSVAKLTVLLSGI